MSKHKSKYGQYDKVDKTPILKAAKEERPSFSHRYICLGQHCIKKCDLKEFKSLSDKLRMLSDLEWKQIESSPFKGNGREIISRKSLKREIPATVPADAPILIFQFGGSKTGRMAGYRDGAVFHILFIETKFDLYDHE